MTIQDQDTGAVIPMMMRGTRDYSGPEALRRENIIGVIRDVYQLFGAEQLETPTVETTRTLGVEEGETGKNIFRLTVFSPVVGYGLRFDHTVPLARFASMNWRGISQPWTRYAIGPVYRDERGAGAGRLSQFTQCDIDTIGEQNAPLVDAQNVAIAYQILDRLGFEPGQYEIRINDRRLMNAIVASLGLGDQTEIVLREWDKLEKQDRKAIRQNLRDSGMGEMQIKVFDRATDDLLEITKSEVNADDKLRILANEFPTEEVYEATQSLREMFIYVQALGVPESVYALYPLLARGLGYYTGPIFETVVTGADMGSIMGGGRFDNLIENLGGPDWPASGFSFGLERLMDVMRELGILPSIEEDNLALADVFIALVNPGDQAQVAYAMEVAQKLRLTGLAVKLYTGGASKLGAQIALANKQKIPVTVIIGPDEVETNLVQAKNMDSGEQEKLRLDQLQRHIWWWLNL